MSHTAGSECHLSVRPLASQPKLAHAKQIALDSIATALTTTRPTSRIPTDRRWGFILKRGGEDNGESDKRVLLKMGGNDEGGH